MQDWSDELLAHELCEELVISAPTKDGEVVNTIVFRCTSPLTHVGRLQTRGWDLGCCPKCTQPG